MIKLIAFLGNRGKEYEKTRHNAGFLLSDYLYPSLSWQSKFHSFYAQDGERKIIKPLQYMNLSGTAVSEAASFFKIKSSEILVVHDDMSLDAGEYKVQRGGGTKGHNGVKNIRDRLGTDDFPRLRIGIGKPIHGDTALFVTSPFTKDEMTALECAFSSIKKEWTLILNQK